MQERRLLGHAAIRVQAGIALAVDLVDIEILFPSVFGKLSLVHPRRLNDDEELPRGVRCCTAWLPAPFCGTSNRTTKAYFYRRQLL